jgi:1L-myo-inositol 1-phosphate cytidylyltransferase / CDP-L-myo-inositol myo-inositolphosphotransferase
LYDERTGGLRIAALTLLDRLVVAIHRAGSHPITIVSPEQPPALERAAALGIPVRFESRAELLGGETLVAWSSLLVQAADVRKLLRDGGRLVTPAGRPLPIGLLRPGDTPCEAALDALPVQVASGVACAVTDAAVAREAQRTLWDSLGSSSDGLVDRVINRPCGRFLSKVLVHTPVSPNAVSVTSVGIGLVAAWFFAVGNHNAVILAALLFQFSAMVDCVDGDLARVLFKESALGKWLDLAGDQVVHVTVFAAMAAGIMQTGQSRHGLSLGLSAVLGAIISFAVVLRGMRQPVSDRSPLLQKLIDSTTNRDFSVLVLVLACFNRLHWFLWMSAIGSHLFWMTALALQFRARSAGNRAR